MNLIDLLSESRKVKTDELLGLVSTVERILSEERRTGRCGNAIVRGGLIHIDPTGGLIVVGDIHGDLDSLSHILREASLPTALSVRISRILFLGDYVDRGDSSVEVLYLILRLKQLFPTSVFLLRGNHEGPSDLSVSPQDLSHDLVKFFGEQGIQIYHKLQELFNDLYLAAVLEKRYFFVHGGVPSLAKSADDVANAQSNHPSRTDLEEILWSDPIEIPEGTAPSDRGAGKLFGKNVTRNLLDLLGVKVMIRGHSPAHEGAAAFHDGMVLTVFSRKGAPYFNATAAYLSIDCASAALDANRLAEVARRF